MRSWALALVLLAGCGGGSSEEGEALASEDAITSTSLSFSAAGTPIDLNVSSPKNLDLTVEAPGRTIGLQLFLADSQIASGLGKDTARIRSFPVVAGTYRLVVKDLAPNPRGGSFTFTGGLATSRVIRTTAEGYLVGAGANDAATAKTNWATACKKWQALVFAVSPGHEGEIELVDCGEPEAIATVAGGKRQVESRSRVVVVVDERRDGSRIPVRDEHSTSGDTRPTVAEAHAAWMDQCFIDMLAQTDTDRRLGKFVTVACTKPRGFVQYSLSDPSQVVGISDSSPFKKWIFAE